MSFAIPGTRSVAQQPLTFDQKPVICRDRPKSADGTRHPNAKHHGAKDPPCALRQLMQGNFQEHVVLLGHG